VSELSESLHAERTAAGSTHVDCWACEAAQSQTVRELAASLRLARRDASHSDALLERLIPDEDRLKQVWKGYWAEVLGVGVLEYPSVDDLTQMRDEVERRIAEEFAKDDERPGE
jgi:hypothetical protein